MRITTELGVGLNNLTPRPLIGTTAPAQLLPDTPISTSHAALYWQGDETKWKAAYNGGAGKTYVGPVAWDESTGVNAVQISVPILDHRKVIGVLIMGVRINYVELKTIQAQGPSGVESTSW